jgi:hypothetical protein
MEHLDLVGRIGDTRKRIINIWILTIQDIPAILNAYWPLLHEIQSEMRSINGFWGKILPTTTRALTDLKRGAGIHTLYQQSRWRFMDA